MEGRGLQGLEVLRDEDEGRGLRDAGLRTEDSRDEDEGLRGLRMQD